LPDAGKVLFKRTEPAAEEKWAAELGERLGVEASRIGGGFMENLLFNLIRKVGQIDIHFMAYFVHDLSKFRRFVFVVIWLVDKGRYGFLWAMRYLSSKSRFSAVAVRSLSAVTFVTSSHHRHHFLSLSAVARAASA